nr:probable ADP-ribosylation factor GTPase-activating protein AGD11 [Tanacetum cinerariifolium]
MVNSKYEASVPDSSRKPKTDSSIEERLEFIRMWNSRSKMGI